MYLTYWQHVEIQKTKREFIFTLNNFRSHIGRRLRMDSLQSEDLLTDHHGLGTSNSHHLYHHVQSDVIRCPHHVALPDSERVSDRDVHHRTSFQVSFFFLLLKTCLSRHFGLNYEFLKLKPILSNFQLKFV